MLFRNFDHWKNKENLLDLAFFVQRMAELTFEYTLDSYRAPTTNAPFLVDECLSSIMTKRSLGSENKEFLHIYEELKNRMSGNLIVDNLISLKKSSYTKYSDVDIQKIEENLRILKMEIEPRVYAFTAFKLLKESIEKGNRDDIDFLSRELVVTLKNLGVSSFHMNAELTNYFFSDNVIDSLDSVDGYFVEIFPHVHDFRVCMKIKAPINYIDKNILDAFDITIHRKVPKEFSGGDVARKWEPTNSGEHIIQIQKLGAKDKYTAVKKALESVSQMHNVYGLFNHKADFNTDENFIIFQKCCKEKVFELKEPPNRMRFVEDNKPIEASKKMMEMMGSLRISGGDDAGKFSRVIDFHGMSARSNIVENQIINIWTALETISPERGNNNTIIKNVVSGVVPFIGIQYFRRRFKNLTLDIIRWDRRALKHILPEVEGADLVEKIFCLVVFEENEKSLEELFKRIGNFELLRYRIFNVRKDFLKPSKSITLLERHMKRVEWQIYRIYRARNTIIHTGNTPIFSESLVTNAHDYFDQVFSLSLELCSGQRGYSNYRDCFNFANSVYEEYKSFLMEKENFCEDDVKGVLWRPTETISPKEILPL